MNKKIIKAYALKNAIEHKGKAQSGSVIPGLFNHGLKKDKIKETMPEINKIISEINKFNSEQQKKEFSKLEHLIGHRQVREGLPELPNTKKPVVMRFSPSPSGPLHIGHALTSSLSFLYVQKYKGTFYIRIEDTNPENIYKPAYKMIEQESSWLFKNRVKFVIQSERMKIYYKYLEKLIKTKSAYVCTCPSESFKEFSTKKQNCPCRNINEKEQLERWGKMLDKKGFKEGQAVVRFKSDMKNKNPAFRDFPLARINTHPHPLQKNKYKVWPLMNLAVAVDDIEQKMTHIIRAKEHRDNAERQKMIFKALGKQKQFPWTGFLGRIHLKDFELSASKMRHDVESGKYKSWDDPRLPTLASLKKQGYTPQAFHRFAEQIGLNEVDKNIDKKEFFLLLDNFETEKK